MLWGDLVTKSDIETQLSLLKKDLIISLGAMQITIAVLILGVMKYIILQWQALLLFLDLFLS